jgi:hypothetical protein
VVKVMGFTETLRPDVREALERALEGTQYVTAMDTFWDAMVDTLRDVIISSVRVPPEGGVSEEELRVVQETLSINVVAALYGFVASELHCVREGRLCADPKHVLFNLLANPKNYVHPKPMPSDEPEETATFQSGWEAAAAVLKEQENAAAMAVLPHEKGN